MKKALLQFQALGPFKETNVKYFREELLKKLCNNKEWVAKKKKTKEDVFSATLFLKGKETGTRRIGIRFNQNIGTLSVDRVHQISSTESVLGETPYQHTELDEKMSEIHQKMQRWAVSASL